MLEAWSFLTRNINKAGKLISFSVMAPTVAQEHLDHAGVVAGVVARPRGAVLHDPSFRGYFHRLCNQCVDPNFEFFILSLPKMKDKDIILKLWIS